MKDLNGKEITVGDRVEYEDDDNDTLANYTITEMSRNDIVLGNWDWLISPFKTVDEINYYSVKKI